MNLYLIRHGQTDWNLQKKLQGREDISLNNTGREQAAVCGRALKKIPFSCIYTSPLSRASETAAILSKYTNFTPIVIEPLLIEREFGIGSGMTHQELHQKYPDYPAVIPEGSEPFLDLCERMKHAVFRCIEHSCDEKPILLVSHGGSINALLHTLTNGRIGSGVTTLKNTCINILSYQSDTKILTVEEYNLTPEEYLAKSLLWNRHTKDIFTPKQMFHPSAQELSLEKQRFGT